MKVSLPTNHNYYEECCLDEEGLKEAFSSKNKSALKKLQTELFSSEFALTTKAETLEQVKIFGFKNNQNKMEDEEQLILRLYSKIVDGKKKYIIQTGLFAGVIYHKGYQFNIGTRYGDTFLTRMLNYVNDIYVDTKNIRSEKSDEINDFNNILAYLFIQSLEKSALLGLPKKYENFSQHSNKVRGKIDLNSYFKKSIPFMGKLTTNYREQAYIQEIVDVLYMACTVLEKKFGKEIHRKILGVLQLLKQNFSGVFPNKITIAKSKKHITLQNPMYSGFKSTLIYAGIILQNESLMASEKKSNLNTYGYLFDISQLFEVYLEKLLASYFHEWHISSQEEINVYDGMFYKRRMFPDLVLRHKETNKIIVFDAKFKKMGMENWDLDRSDFYQIHSYIQYYRPAIIMGGLLYPLWKDIDVRKSYADRVFDNSESDIKFIVDGILVTKEMSIDTLIQNEKNFLLRLDESLKSVVVQ